MSKRYSGALITKTPVVPTSLSAPGVWSLSDQAAAQATNTWPFPRDPQFKNVTMLLHGDGSAGPVAATGVGAGVSSTVTNFNADASTNNFNVAINGDARSDRFTPYQEGYYSNYLNGSSNFTTGTTASNFLCTGSATGITATFEAWVFPTAYSTGVNSYNFSAIHAKGGVYFNFGIRNGAVRFYWYDGAQKTVDSASTSDVPLNTWTHIALTISGSTIKIYINGVLNTTSATYTGVQSAGSGATEYIGLEVNGTYFNGYISNYRFTNTVVYSAAFTPSTTPLTAVTGTQLLTCQSNRFIDNSTNAFTITPVSSPQVSPAQPFTLPNSVATYGSGYFDGTGDWLQTPSNSAFNFSATDCTLEFWYYGAGASGLVFEFGSSTPDTAAMQCEFSSGTLTFKPIGATSSFFAIQKNAWNYIAAVKTGTTYYLYINGTRNTASTGTAASTGQIINIGARNGGSTAPITGYLSNFRVSNTARYTGTTMTVPTTPLSTDANTQLLINQYNGGGNNSGFKDSGPFNFPITRNGNTTQGTFTPYGSNWSNYFDGTGDYLTTASSSSFNIGTNSFCVEFWVYTSGFPTGGVAVGLVSASYNTNFHVLGWQTNIVRFYIVNSFVDSNAINLNAWNHIACVRNGTSAVVYINGVAGTATTLSGTGANSALYVGSSTHATSETFTGYLSNVRFVNGSAVYTSNFTPSTTPLTAITNTQLLTCQSNRFIDNSSNAFAITKVGDTSVQRFSPFAPLTVYNPATNGGSGYFDGSGDYLSSPNVAFASNNFTVEGWFYPTTIANLTNFWGMNNGSGAVPKMVMYINSSGNLNIDMGSVGTTQFPLSVSASTYLKANAWQHIAIVRSGTGASQFVLYINGTSVATGQLGTNISSITAGFNIGYVGEAYGQTFSGYVTDFRINNGTAVYTGNFTPSTTPLTAITNTSLLTNMTNGAIFDNAMMNDLETVGNAQISTSVKKYGAASIAFDGTGDYLLLQGGPNFTFGTGDFTIEMWIYVVSGLSADIVYYDGRPTSTNGLYNIIYTNSTGKLVYSTNSADRITGTTTLSTGTWYHIALCRSGTSTKLFLSGTQEGSTYTDSNSYIVGANRPVIGGNGYTLGNAPLNGYIDDLRITKYARYTTTFTVPDQAFPNG